MSVNIYDSTNDELVNVAGSSGKSNAETLIKDTVGWTGKNLLKNIKGTITANGVTWKLNPDGSITVNGTAGNGNSYYNINYLSNNFHEDGITGSNLLGKTLISSMGGVTIPQGFRWNIGYFEVNSSQWHIIQDNVIEDYNITVTENMYKICEFFRIDAGVTISNFTFYPMIRRADITDDTYEPYHESVETMYEEEIHGINLLPAVYARCGSVIHIPDNNGYYKSANNDDARTWAYANSDLFFSLKAGTYRFKGFVSVATTNTNRGVRIYDDSNNNILSYGHKDGSNNFEEILATDGVTFTLDKDANLGLLFKIFEGIYAFAIYPEESKETRYFPYNFSSIDNRINSQTNMPSKNLLKIADGTYTKDNIVQEQDSSTGIITINGTGINSEIAFINDPNLSLLRGKYIFSVEVENALTNNWGVISLRCHNILRNVDTFCDIQYSRTGYEIKLNLTDDFYLTGWGQIYYFSGVTFTDMKIKAMLRLAAEEDDTFEPYNNKPTIYTNNSILGTKNLLPYPYADASKTVSGLTFTDNGDGTVTLNGTYTGTNNARYQLALQSNFTLPAGKYIITSGHEVPYGNPYRVIVALYKNGSSIEKYYSTNFGSSNIFTLNAGEYDGLSVYIEVIPNVAPNNITIYPMIRLASDPGDTYQPYAMTNRELTDKIESLAGLSVFNANYTTGIQDCNAFNGVFATTGSRTLNTPYKTGMTGPASGGMLIQLVPNSSAGYNTQIYIVLAYVNLNTSTIITNNTIFIRGRTASNPWTPWQVLI